MVDLQVGGEATGGGPTGGDLQVVGLQVGGTYRWGGGDLQVGGYRWWPTGSQKDRWTTKRVHK